MTNYDALSSRWPEVIGLAWADDDFRRRLLSDPARELQAMGIEAPDSLRVIEEASGQEAAGEGVLVMPQPPQHIVRMMQGARLASGTYGTCEPSKAACDSDAPEKPEKPSEPDKKEYIS